MTLSAFTSQAINATVARADAAFFQYCSGFISPGSQLSTVMKFLINCYLSYSSVSCFFLPFLTTSTATGGARIVSNDTFLAPLLDFFGSLRR